MGWANDSIRSMLAPFEVLDNTATRYQTGLMVDGKIIKFYEASVAFLTDVYCELKDDVSAWKRNKYNVKDFNIANCLEAVEKELKHRGIKASKLCKYKCACGHMWCKENSMQMCKDCGKPYCIFCGYKHDCK